MESIRVFWTVGHEITGHKLNGSKTTGYRIFRSFFGTSPMVYAVVWDLLLTLRPRKSKPVHLLWALLLLKRYHVESINATLTLVNQKTFRKWSLVFIKLIAEMPVVIYGFIKFFSHFFKRIFQF